MRDDVRVRRDWIDVRHEFLQDDGNWMAGMCVSDGRENACCAQCLRDNERQPHVAIRHAFTGKLSPHRSAQIVLATHLYIHADTVVDDLRIDATPFRRLWIAFHLNVVGGLPIDDDAMLAARTAGEMIRLALAPEELEGAR